MPYIPSPDHPQRIGELLPRSTESWYEYARRLGLTRDDRMFERFGASPAGRTLLPEQVEQRRRLLKDIEQGLKRQGQQTIELKITADEMFINRDVLDTLGVDRSFVCILAKGKYCQFIFCDSHSVQSWWYRRQIVSNLPESIARVDASLLSITVHLSYDDEPAAEAIRETIRSRAIEKGYTFSITIEPLVMHVQGRAAR